jgi:cell division protein FtsB
MRSEGMKRKLKLYLSPLQEKRFYRIVAVLLTASLAWLVFAPQSGVLALLQKRTKIKTLENKTLLLERSNKDLEQEINRLRTDPAYLEEVARREHGLLKKNEIIYDFSPQKKK